MGIEEARKLRLVRFENFKLTFIQEKIFHIPPYSIQKLSLSCFG